MAALLFTGACAQGTATTLPWGDLRGEGAVPYPLSPVFELESIGEPVRVAELDGDNWPMTWAADGALYAAYGDGWGAREIQRGRKLNTGLVRIEGDPPELRPSELTCPYFGGGGQDPNFKGCGLLAVDGFLYHFLRYQIPGPEARIQTAAKLIWSSDGGRTWHGDDYQQDPSRIEFFFREPDRAFSSPTFLQAGQAYTAAPDAFVYVYAPGEDRRRRNDTIVLARVPRDDVARRESYEFFAGLDDSARPVWSRDIADRRPVFRFPEHVMLGDVIYLPQAKRFVLATCWAADDAPSRLAIFDAPSPWGPWTTVGYLNPWGSGSEGDTRYEPRLPAKWISESSGELVLVFSNRQSSDKFNYQRLRLRKRAPGERAPFIWTRGEAAREGFDPARLEALGRRMALLQTEAFLVIRHDRIVHESYAHARGPQIPVSLASVAKALVGSVALLVAVRDGWLGLDTPVSAFVPEYAQDPQRAQIRIRHLASHLSGLEDAEQGRPGWHERFWNSNPFAVALREVPLVAAPGEGLLYSNTGFAVLGYCLAKAARADGSEDVPGVLRDTFRRLDIGDDEWRLSYGRRYELDGLWLDALWGGARMTARAVARVARLFLHEGRWQGETVLPAALVRSALQPALPPERWPDAWPVPGLGWWSNSNGAFPSLPRDAFLALGSGHRVVLVVPSLDLIVVRLGRELRQPLWGPAAWRTLDAALFAPLMDALGIPLPEAGLPPTAPPATAKR